MQRALSLAVATLLATPLLAMDARPMTAVDLIDVPLQRELRVSPDGTRVLFTRVQANWDEDKLVTHIWKVHSDGSGLVQMTNGTSGESSPRWSPDGARMAFTATRDGETSQIWVMSTSGGEAFKVSDHETDVSDIAWSADGSSIFFLADDPESEEEEKHNERIGEVYSYDRDFKQQHLWRLEMESEEETRLTEGDYSVLSYHFSVDGRSFAYRAGPTPLYDDDDESEVWIRNLENGEPRRLTDNHVAEGGVRLSPNGDSVLFLADANQRFEDYYESNLFVVPASGGPSRLLAGDFQHEVLDAEWLDDGDHILLLSNLGVRTQLFRLGVVGGELEQLTEGDHAIYFWHARPAADTVGWVAYTPTSPGDVWTAGLDPFRPLRSNGVETELLVFPDQPHGLRRLKHRLHKINSEIVWFERHLRGNDYEVETPPGDDAEEEEEEQEEG